MMLSVMSNETAFEALRNFLVSARNAEGLKQSDVARRGGIPVGSISNFEAGVRPAVPKQATLAKMAVGYGVSYQVLDRLSRGEPAIPTDDREALANLLADSSPRVRRLLMEAATWPEGKRLAFEAGLVGLIEALRPDAQR